jgi:hypothetical protein
VPKRKKEAWTGQTSKAFQKKNTEVLIHIGRNKFTCQDMMKWGCRNFAAARLLTKALEPLTPKSVKDLIVKRRFTVDDFFSLDGVGEASMWVFMNTIHACGVDVDAWLNTALKISTLHEQGRRARRPPTKKVITLRRKAS